VSDGPDGQPPGTVDTGHENIPSPHTAMPDLVTRDPADVPPVAAEVERVQDAIEAAETTDPDEPDPPPYLRFDCTVADAPSTAAGAEAARLAVERGDLVVLPTDTVYGIGADAFNAEAVQRLLDAKVRGRDMPPPVLIADPSLIRALAVDIPQAVEDVIAAHWPGPLTVICRARQTLRMDLGDTAGTVALRVPDHDLARDLLRRTGPLAVSSANISGLPAAVTCEEALDQLGPSVAVYLDGGPLGGASAAPSTIVDFSQNEGGEVLRRGALPTEVLRETLPDLVDLVPTEDDPEPSLEPDQTGGPDTASPPTGR
jgi:L-threonylcarbamoyladenylate synthase